jgi:hypothetical protein
MPILTPLSSRWTVPLSGENFFVTFTEYPPVPVDRDVNIATASVASDSEHLCSTEKVLFIVFKKGDQSLSPN